MLVDRSVELSLDCVLKWAASGSLSKCLWLSPTYIDDVLRQVRNSLLVSFEHCSGFHSATTLPLLHTGAVLSYVDTACHRHVLRVRST
jgi:hypothetical protein